MFLLLGGGDLVSLDRIAARYGEIDLWVAANRALAIVLFTLIYTTLVAISFPGAWALTVLGGLLFGTLLGGSLAVVGAAAGATVVFLAARSAFAETLKARAGARLGRLREGFEANAVSYLLTLRLVPVFPFFLINIAAGVFGMRLAPYVMATAAGIVPGTFVYASLGAGAASVVREGGTIDAKGLLLRPEILLPIAGLVLLALLPVLVKRLRARPLAPPKA